MKKKRENVPDFDNRLELKKTITINRMMDGMVKIWGMIFKNLLDWDLQLREVVSMFFSKDGMLRFTLLYI